MNYLAKRALLNANFNIMVCYNPNNSRVQKRIIDMETLLSDLVKDALAFNVAHA